MPTADVSIAQHIDLFRERFTRLLITSPMPAIAITDERTGDTRQLSAVTPMYDAEAGMGDVHFGQNVYLADGTYTVTITVGDEQAQFRGVMVTAVQMATPTGTPPTATATSLTPRPATSIGATPTASRATEPAAPPAEVPTDMPMDMPE